MRARLGFIARSLTSRTTNQNKTRRQTRRFEGLEARQVLSATGICGEFLEGDPDRPEVAEVAEPMTNDAVIAKLEGVHDGDAAGEHTGVWDDTDIVHVFEGMHHDEALQDLDFASAYKEPPLEFLQALAKGEVDFNGGDANEFFDIFLDLTEKDSFFDIFTELTAGDHGDGQSDGFFDVFTELTSGDGQSDGFFDVWTELSGEGQRDDFEMVKVELADSAMNSGEVTDAVGDQSNGAIFVKIPGIIDVGDLPDGFTSGASIIDVGDLPDGLTNSFEEVKVTIGDQSNGAIFVKIPGIIDVGDLPHGLTSGASIIDVGDLPDGLTNGFEEIKVTIGDQSNGAIFVKIPGIIDVGDLPDGYTSSLDEVTFTIGDQSNGAIFVKIPGIIDVGDLPDGLTDSFEEIKVTIGDQSNGAIFVKIPGLMDHN